LLDVKLQRDTSYDGVLDLLRNKIIDGSFPPGTRLKQSIIASQLGVSMSPVREALIRLVDEGLVESTPYRGMIVGRLTQHDVEEIYDLRLALEFSAIQKALPKLQNPSILEKANLLIKNIQKAENLKDFEKAVVADLNFHRYYVKFSDNERLIKSWDSLYAQSRYILHNLYYVQTHTSGNNIDFGDHSRISNAIITGDQQIIYHTLSEHMKFAASTLIRLWDIINGEHVRKT